MAFTQAAGGVVLPCVAGVRGPIEFALGKQPTRAGRQRLKRLRSRSKIRLVPMHILGQQAANDDSEKSNQNQDHERRLEELKRQSWLTPDEEIEEKRLKKLKLYLKDQMESLRRAAS